MKAVVGVDLGGAKSKTTALAALFNGRGKPTLTVLTPVGPGASPLDATNQLLVAITDALDGATPATIAIDAPLSMPPCLSCDRACTGPGTGGSGAYGNAHGATPRCQSRAAIEMWESGGNPLTERYCEFKLRRFRTSDGRPEFRAGRPLHALGPGIAQITPRGIALRRLIESGALSTGKRQPEVVEVYPYASRRRLEQWDPQLRPREKGLDRVDSDGKFDKDGPTETWSHFAKRQIRGLRSLIEDPKKLLERDDVASEVSGPHLVDAVIVAYTGWLVTEGHASRAPDKQAADDEGWIALPCSTRPPNL